VRAAAAEAAGAEPATRSDDGRTASTATRAAEGEVNAAVQAAAAAAAWLGDRQRVAVAATALLAATAGAKGPFDLGLA
jgi:hypothetical protein